MEPDQRREPIPKYGHPAFLIPLLLLGGGIALWLAVTGRHDLGGMVLMVTLPLVFCLRWSAYWQPERKKRHHDDG
jgi:hypothetical protein